MSQFIEMFGDPMVNDKQWSEYSCISEITQIVLGSTPNSKEPSYWDGDIRWITPAEMTDQSYYIFDTVRHITDEGRKAANLTVLPEGTVLFSTRAPIGKVAIVGKEMCCNQGFKNFICSEKLNNVFLYYTLKLKKDYLCSLGTGTTFKELSKRTVESLKIAVPPIELQNQFETIYNQADKSGFDGRKSQFIEMFGNPVTNNKEWNTLPIKDVAPETPSIEKRTGKVWILNLDMIESNTGKVVEKVFENDSNLLSVAPFDEGNVLYSKLRPYLNKVVIPDGKGYATTELVPLRPNQKLLNLTFFSHLLRGDEFVTYANSISAGTKMPRMPLNDLRKFQCILPPMEKQNEFEEIARHADKSGSVLQHMIAC